MSGASGPMVTVQIPSDPLVIGCGLPSSSPLTVTWDAFGARYRSVSVRSAETSGDITEGPRPPRPPGPAGVAGGCASAAVAVASQAPSTSPEVRAEIVRGCQRMQSLLSARMVTLATLEMQPAD